jgi:hypothetical protein
MVSRMLQVVTASFIYFVDNLGQAKRKHSPLIRRASGNIPSKMPELWLGLLCN